MKAKDLLMKEAEELTKGSLTEFGFRERIRFERALFLFLKQLCSDKFHYNLRGLSSSHRDSLMLFLNERKDISLLIQGIDQVFQLRIFLQSLTSENGYVRGDALSSAGVDRTNALKFIYKQVLNIIGKVDFNY